MAYYITNGKAIKIKCIKNQEMKKLNMKIWKEEIKVNDGNTFVNICHKNADVTIE